MTSIANTEKKDNTADVVIIGAGIAGLQCANHVKKSHTLHKVLVLEARDRIGGRIYTTKGYGPKTNVIEHGAQFIHGCVNENPVVQLAIKSGAVKKLKNLRFIDWDDGYVYKGVGDKRKQFSDKITDKAYESFVEYLNISCSDKKKFIKSKNDRNIDMSLGKEFIKVLYERKNNIEDHTCTKEEYKKLIECTARMEISDDYGVDLENLSLAYWDQDDEYAYDVDCTFPNQSGGYESLIKYLAKPLSNDIVLNHVVQHIEFGSGKNTDSDDNNSNVSNDTNHVKVTCTNGAVFHCKKLVCTIPLGYLKKHHKELFKYVPNMPAEINDAIHYLKMGNLEKVFLRFKRPFWKIDTDTFFNYSGNPFRIFMNINRMNGNNNSKKTDGYVLMCFVSGSYAKSLMSSMSRREITLLALSSLREIFGPKQVPLDEEKALSLLLENNEAPSSLVTRWCCDPYTLGCYSHMPINALPKDYHAFEKAYFNNTLHFAGEHTIAKYAGSVHGALLSGIRAAKSEM